MRTDHAATTPVRKHHKLLSTMSQRNDHEYCPLLGKRHSQKQMANREERESKIRRSSREKRTSYIKHTILAHSDSNRYNHPNGSVHPRTLLSAAEKVKTINTP